MKFIKIQNGQLFTGRKSINQCKLALLRIKGGNIICVWWKISYSKEFDLNLSKLELKTIASQEKNFQLF